VGGGGGGEEYSSIMVTGRNEDFFWAGNFRSEDFLG